MNTEQKLHDIEHLADPICRAQGVELVQARLLREPSGYLLRIMIDKPGSEEGAGERDAGGMGASGVTLDDCVDVSRGLSVSLDEADFLDSAYRLEVTSPGLERPLVKHEDYQRFSGREVSVHFNERIQERRKVTGVLTGMVHDHIRIETEEGLFEVPIGQIQKANLVYRESNTPSRGAIK